MALSRASYVAQLRALAPSEWPAYLTGHSNLPGPRANLTLLDAAADVLSHDAALTLIESDDEYLACCGVATLGRLILEDPGDAELVALLTRAATDHRWRVREGAAIAAQRVGDHDAARLRAFVDAWSRSPDPLVVRCAIASVCEPRLLSDPQTSRAAIDACQRATDLLVAASPADRRTDGFRTLRKSLGYCWSVAVAADPERGLPVFLALPTDDRDVAWVVRENRSKKRLAGLLPN